MLEFYIGAKSVDESNEFLRKLWNELMETCEFGWYFMPHRRKNRIHIGNTNIGEISFDYKIKGCINNLYIDNNTEIEKIKKAVNNASKKESSSYIVCFILYNDFKYNIYPSSIKNVKIEPINNKTNLYIKVNAYSHFDAEYFSNKISRTILALLYEYTNIRFYVEKMVLQNYYDDFDISLEDYNYEWMDYDELPLREELIVLPIDFFKLISNLMYSNDDNYYLLINSAKQLFETKIIVDSLGSGCTISVISDIINSMAISTLEPLSYILDKSHELCPSCKNEIYSIVSKIKKLVTKYFNESFATRFCKTFYNDRSKFLHEGSPTTTEYYVGRIYPQINPNNPSEMLLPSGSVNYNMFEYSSAIFRKIAHDYFNETLITTKY